MQSITNKKCTLLLFVFFFFTFCTFRFMSAYQNYLWPQRKREQEGERQIENRELIAIL